jgi:peptide/nickel transport system substrate-binding protein
MESEKVGLNSKIDRATFLRFSAVAGMGTIVVACGGNQAPAAPAATQAPAQAAAPAAPTQAPAPTQAAPTPAAAAATATPAPVATSAAIATATEVTATSQYKESPLVAADVKAGKLPPVDQRLPQKPYVPPHPWLKPGNYGGTLTTVVNSSDDSGLWNWMFEGMYGHSPLRWLKDGLAIGPGLAESWETNADQSEWTIHFRKGLKWSDGQPWSTDDIMFWWEDEVQTPELKEYPPDEAKSGKGTLMNLVKVDDSTITMKFDASAPLTADRLAMWVNRQIGPRWMDPKHYLQQFHPKYNPSVDKTKWVDDFLIKRNPGQDPKSPTMNGWMLQAYNKGQNTTWVRNPFYYAVDKQGNQLPYLDKIVINNVQDAEVYKLQVTQGKIDYMHPNYSPIALTDIATLQQNQAQSGLELRLWDSGSGTSSMYFFNYDFAEPKMRALIRNPKFRQALSLAYNRANVQKAVYFNTGEPTTGTLSPKALEYHVQGGSEVYASWRDSYNKYDPAQANKLLDELGLKKGANGFRTMPDGSPLNVTLNYQSDQSPTGEHVRKDEFLAKDWQAVGINAKLNPVSPTSWDELWTTGKTMTHTAWEVGDGPNHLVYPQWMVPLETSRWAPLIGQFAEVIGTPAEKTEQNVDPYQRKPPRAAPDPNGPIQKIWDLYNQTKLETDVTKRTQLVWQIIKVHVSDGPFFSGTVANTPRPILVRKGLMNVPTRDDLGTANGYQFGFVNPWIHPTPAVYDPETYYWDDPTKHS